MTERGKSVPVAVEGLALAETGASLTCVDQDAASQAGLNAIDRGSIASASYHAHSVPVFAFAIEVASFGKIRLPRAMGVPLANYGLLAVVGWEARGSTDLA